MTSQRLPSTLTRWGAAHTLALAATLLAAALRIWHLGSLPPQAWYDEIWFAVQARDLLQTGRLVAHYGILDTAGNAGLVYLTALVRLFGVDSMVGARVAAALGGLLTVPLAYACLREMLRADFGERRHLIAALTGAILAYLASMVILGRVGMEPALAPPVALFSLWQVMLGLRRGKLSHWGMAGLVAGLTQYNGPHARFVLPVLAYLVLDTLLVHRSTFAAGDQNPLGPPLHGVERGTEGVRLRWWLGLLILFAVGALVNIPLIVTFAQHPDWFYGRASAVSAGVSLPENFLRVAGAFFVAGDLNARQNVPGQPMLDVVLSIGFVAGLVWAVWRIRRSRAARLLLVWLVVMSLPAALTAEAPNFGRMIGAAPPAAALAVIGWLILFDWLRSRQRPLLGERVRANLWIAAAGLIVFSLAWNVVSVFWRWAGSPVLGEAFTTASVSAARDLAGRAQSGQAVYVERMPEVLDEPAFTYAFAGTDVRRVDFRQCVPLVADPSGEAAYLFLPEDDGGGPGLLKAYPRLDWRDVEILWGRQARLGLGEGGVEMSGPGAWFAPGIRLVQARVGPAGTVALGDELRLRMFWLVEAHIPADLMAFVHVQPAGSTMLAPAAQDDRRPCGEVYPSTSWQTGEIIAYAASIRLPADLSPGDYVVSAGWYDPLTGLRSLLISANESLPDNRAVIGRVRIGR